MTRHVLAMFPRSGTSGVTVPAREARSGACLADECPKFGCETTIDGDDVEADGRGQAAQGPPMSTLMA